MLSYNHAHYLPQSLDAILNQSFPPSELLIIDDASTDNSIEVIQRYAKEYPAIRLVQNEKNMGSTFGQALGYRLAKGDYAYCASADDTVLPGFFEKSVRLMDQYPQAGLCSGVSVVVDGENRYEVPFPPYVATVPSYLDPKEVLNCYVKKDWFIMGNTTIFRKSVLSEKTFPDEIGRFNDEFTILMLSLRYGACFIPECLSIFNIRPNSYSSNRELEIFAQRRKAETLMATTHSEYFPPEFVRFFSKLNTYTEAMFALRNMDLSINDHVEKLGSVLKNYKLTKLLILTLTRKLVQIQKLFIKIVLYFQLDRFSMFRIYRYFSLAFGRMGRSAD